MKLNNNALKLIALVTMTLDHIGLVLFPRVLWLRLIGRLAMPIYAYMIAEGCTHTASMGKYLGTMAAFAAVCQGAYLFCMASLYQCILVTFSLSIGLIWLIRWAKGQQKLYPWLAVALGVGAVYFVTVWLPRLLPGTDFSVDYGFWGVMLPVGIYLGRTKGQKLLLAAGLLALVAFTGWEGQWFALAALLLLARYDGTRGRWKLKWLFYFYYPLHLLVLHGISYL